MLDDLALLTEAAHLAAETATRFVGGALDVQHKPDDAGPVTAADLAVNDVLEHTLRTARPDYGWLSEESIDGTDRQNAEHVFIIDPIDGTRSFIEGSNTWAHSLAIARNGQITAAVVMLPMRGKLYSAAKGQGAYLNDEPIMPSTAHNLETSHILTTKPNLQPQFWTTDPVPEFKRSHRPSLAYRLSLVAQGSFDGMFTFRPSWEWDIAAGALILNEAGATVTDKAGAPLLFNNPHPQTNGVIAGPAALHADIANRLV